ncbi:hypothetical protein HAX54_014194 [Datura stramonium]|uniref:Uncharacterized protein n=1 Tax=Datura stramonium TaxID=4076 RepID=A0ABS8TQC1_DATST|nr:hypothetical protein [Datura stramonium]
MMPKLLLFLLQDFQDDKTFSTSGSVVEVSALLSTLARFSSSSSLDSRSFLMWQQQYQILQNKKKNHQ